jgi:CRP-like cAMP-binding protein
VLTIPFHLIGSPSEIPDNYRCSLLKNILEMISNANMRQLYKIDILSKKSLRDRIVLYLSLQAKRKKTNDFLIPFNREEFAAYLCVDRSALSRELGRMQDEGLIQFEKNRFIILSDFTE